jgi:hypothetical protein
MFEAVKQMASIVENSDDAIIAKTPGGISRVGTRPPRGCSATAARTSSAKAHSLLNLDSGSDKATAILTKIRAGQPIEHLETNGVRKDGTVFNASVAISPVRGVDRAVIGAHLMAPR